MWDGWGTRLGGNESERREGGTQRRKGGKTKKNRLRLSTGNNNRSKRSTHPLIRGGGIRALGRAHRIRAFDSGKPISVLVLPL